VRRRRRGIAPLVAIVLAAVGALAATLASGSSPQLGVDLQGGVSVVLQAEGSPSDGAIDQAIEIIRTRVDALGVAEPDIQSQGDAVVAQLPGVKNQRRALEIIGQTAELRFRPVLQAGATPAPPDEGAAGSTTTTVAGSTTTTAAAGGSTTTTAASTSTSEAALAPGATEGELAAAPLLGGDSSSTTSTTAATTTSSSDGSTTSSSDGSTTTSSVPQLDQDEVNELCPVPEPDDDDPNAQVFAPELDDDGNLVQCYLLGPVGRRLDDTGEDPVLLTGSALSSASAKLDPNGAWFVAPTFRSGERGIDLFNAVASQCQPPGETCPTGQLAIVLDGVVKSAPTIQQANFQRDEISITGEFTEREAKDLALVLRYGALPIKFEDPTVETVSASLGRDSLHAGLVAGLVGLGLVAVYMLLYYRALGLVVILGLCVWAALNYSLISFLSETQGLALSLAGVTGIIISIGVTVDSYVVYFERLKDELRDGRTLRSSTERAFRRAFRTILAADISSFIGAALLYWLTVGPVRGFAFFLGLSTILDVVVAWFFTRPTVALLSRNRLFTEAPHLGVARGLGQRAAVAPAGGGR
jgi:preprotein translocase subunit SecD